MLHISAGSKVVSGWTQGSANQAGEGTPKGHGFWLVRASAEGWQSPEISVNIQQ